MKPFDLEAAKRGEPICDRAGNPVRFIAHVHEATNPGKRVIVLTLNGAISLHYENGTYALSDCDSDCDYDLFMATKKVKRERWVNIYSENLEDCLHLTKEKANREAAPSRIACVRVEYEFEE